MIICKYKRLLSKDGKPFEDIDDAQFKTTSELEAYQIIKIWNDRGRLKNDNVDLIWRYDFISCHTVTREDIYNPQIQFHQTNDC